MDIRAQSAVTTVVTLIHGTFARGALWTQEESTLCKELTRHLGSVTFRSFEWTGANSHNARIAAGVLLGKHVLNVKAEFPEARHILIAHSHGGNVIFYSLRDMKVREAICGVVTMGTPFIRCDLRPEHTVVGVVRYLAAALTFAISFVFFATEYEYIKSGDLGTTENWMIVATATLLAVAVWSFLYKPARRWFTRAANRVLIRLQPSSVKVPCLVVHTAGDEAGLLLRTARYVATAPFVLSNVVLGILPAIFGTALLLVGLGEVAGSITELGRQLASDAWFITAICAILMFLSLIAIELVSNLVYGRSEA